MDIGRSVNGLTAELKANPRLRLGLSAIVGILWFYGLLALHDSVQAKRASYEAVSQRVLRMRDIAQQSEWPKRRDEARSLQVKLEHHLWRGSTLGLAQATFHDWLNQAAIQAKLTRVQLLVAGEGEPHRRTDAPRGAMATKLWKVSAKLAFDFDPRTFYPLLRRISNSERKVIIESLTIHRRPTPKAQLLLVAYFLKPPSATTK